MASPTDGVFAEEMFQLAREALEWDWGEAYVITAAPDGWTAKRRDAKENDEPLRASGPEGLRASIQEDYTLRPVPRVPGPGDFPVHDPEPGPDTAYTMDGPLAGRPLNDQHDHCWPAEGICAGCGQVVRREAEDRLWEHTGRMPGDSI